MMKCARTVTLDYEVNKELMNRKIKVSSIINTFFKSYLCLEDEKKDLGMVSEKEIEEELVNLEIQKKKLNDQKIKNDKIIGEWENNHSFDQEPIKDKDGNFIGYFLGRGSKRSKVLVVKGHKDKVSPAKEIISFDKINN